MKEIKVEIPDWLYNSIKRMLKDGNKITFETLKTQEKILNERLKNENRR